MKDENMNKHEDKQDEGEAIPLLLKYYDEFTIELRNYLIACNERWGDTFLSRTRVGQDDRIHARFTDYFDMAKYGNKPMNWLAVIGNAYIAWLRVKHSEMSSQWRKL